MKEAIIGFVGVVVGGSIGLLGTILVFILEHEKWKKEKTIENLRIRKTDLEKRFETCLNNMEKTFETSTWNADSVFDVMYLFPENVVRAYHEIKITGTEKEKRESYYKLMGEMKKSISEIEREIQEKIDRKERFLYFFKI